MNEIANTKKLILFEENKNGEKSIYRQNKDDENKEKVLIYTISKKNINYVFDGEKINNLIIENNGNIPSFINQYGYGFNESSLNYFFRGYTKKDNITTITLSDSKQSKKNGNTLIINNSDIENLISLINQEQRACNDTKKILIKNFLVNIYPEIDFDHQETNNNKELIIRNLNDKLIEKLTADDIQKIGDFYVKATRKFKAAHIIKKINSGLLKNAQLITLQEIINKFEKLLADNPSESTWQSFFNEYITLFDTRYVHKIDYKNIATGITKYPDLVLVDIYGYIDFYELKKSGTKIIDYDNSHKTWYWSKDVSMVISQVTDYLQKAKENAISYSQSIKKETETITEDGLIVNIINPRAIIVIGTTKQLDTQKKKDQFKTLRESLKEIEFILYDELLDRLKNLLDKIKIEK